jgi:acyl-CoA thioesterase FadM
VSYLLRLGGVILRALPAQRRKELLDPYSIPMRVWPSDLDLNLHMNNGRYLTLMDLGRADFIVRAGLGGAFLRKRWRPALGGATLRFRKSLKPFQAFTLTTRLVCWDEKWLYLEQRFDVGEELYASGWVKGLFLDANGKVPTAVVLEGTGLTDSPPMPEALSLWNEGLIAKPAGAGAPLESRDP